MTDKILLHDFWQETLCEIPTIRIFLHGGFFCYGPFLCMSGPLMLRLSASEYPLDRCKVRTLDLVEV